LSSRRWRTWTLRHQSPGLLCVLSEALLDLICLGVRRTQGNLCSEITSDGLCTRTINREKEYRSGLTAKLWAANLQQEVAELSF
jgi:hypothetical protein